jgi:hypothetical protein
MGEGLLKVLIVGFAVWAFWTLLQPRYVFVVRIMQGRPSLRKGKLTRAFLGRLAEVCRENGVVSGWIGGVRQGRRISLRFSRQFSPGLQQRLRNEWALAD